MSESFRKTDMKAEAQLASFMDDYFYSKLRTKSGKLISFSRKNDMESQMRGIDIILEIENRKVIIDEKASLYYSNSMIPTFAFELDSIQPGYADPVEGWFINDNLQTQYYMLIWPNIVCVKEDEWKRKALSKLTKNDFTIVEAIMINKRIIRNWLDQNNCNKSYLVEYAKRIRVKYSNSTEMKSEKIIDGVKISISGQLAEKPINLVIKRDNLLRLAERAYLISQDGYAQIKG